LLAAIAHSPDDTLHPHFREVMRLLAVQSTDDAHYMEVFTRRALLKGRQIGVSTAGGQASLQTLVEEFF
jgi:hypothetical protein